MSTSSQSFTPDSGADPVDHTVVVPAPTPTPEPESTPTPAPAPEPAPKRSCFRVNYFVRGQVKTAFVCAFTGGEASAFLGVEDGSASAYSVAYPVEVVGVDEQHAPLPVLPVTVSIPPPPSQLSGDELAKLRKLLSTT